jgi:hypothetical protein
MSKTKETVQCAAGGTTKQRRPCITAASKPFHADQADERRKQRCPVWSRAVTAAPSTALLAPAGSDTHVTAAPAHQQQEAAEQSGADQADPQVTAAAAGAGQHARPSAHLVEHCCCCCCYMSGMSDRLYPATPFQAR